MRQMRGDAASPLPPLGNKKVWHKLLPNGPHDSLTLKGQVKESLDTAPPKAKAHRRCMSSRLRRAPSPSPQPGDEDEGGAHDSVQVDGAKDAAGPPAQPSAEESSSVNDGLLAGSGSGCESEEEEEDHLNNYLSESAKSTLKKLRRTKKKTKKLPPPRPPEKPKKEPKLPPLPRCAQGHYTRPASRLNSNGLPSIGAHDGALSSRSGSGGGIGHNAWSRGAVRWRDDRSSPDSSRLGPGCYADAECRDNNSAHSNWGRAERVVRELGAMGCGQGELYGQGALGEEERGGPAGRGSLWGMCRSVANLFNARAVRVAEDHRVVLWTFLEDSSDDEDRYGNGNGDDSAEDYPPDDYEDVWDTHHHGDGDGAAGAGNGGSGVGSHAGGDEHRSRSALERNGAMTCLRYRNRRRRGLAGKAPRRMDADYFCKVHIGSAIEKGVAQFVEMIEGGGGRLGSGLGSRSKKQRGYPNNYKGNNNGKGGGGGGRAPSVHDFIAAAARSKTVDTRTAARIIAQDGALKKALIKRVMMAVPHLVHEDEVGSTG